MLPSLKFKLLFQYFLQKTAYATVVAHQKCKAPHATTAELWSNAMKHLFQDKMIYLLKSRGLEMEPAVSARDLLVVRKLLQLDAKSKELHEQINVGDVIVMKDPLDSRKYIVRRLAALEGYEMVSSCEEDEPFSLEHGQCWVLSENRHLQPKELNDSRMHGPICMTEIVGRVIYRFRSLKDHGFMVNNKNSMSRDMPVIYVELPSMELPSVKSISTDVDDKSKD